MKKFLSIISISILLLGTSSCLKDVDSCTPKSVQTEASATPTISSTVTANYVGKFITNNSTFDQTTPATGPAAFPLNGVIAGWQIALPLIQKGGTIKFIIPSSLAYGCTGFRTIGPDEILFFEVTLVDVM